MKKTILLIAVLIVASFALLFYALNATPAKKTPGKLKKIITPSGKAQQKDQARTTLTLSPQSLTLSAADTAQIDVMIDTGINQVTGVQLEVAYDPKEVLITNVNNGTFIPSPTVLLNTNDQKSGRLSYALVINPNQAPVSGSGKVATFSVKKSAESTAGATTVSILNKSLVSALGISGSVLRATGKTEITIVQPASVTNIQNNTVSPVQATPQP